MSKQPWSDPGGDGQPLRDRLKLAQPERVSPKLSNAASFKRVFANRWAHRVRDHAGSGVQLRSSSSDYAQRSASTKRSSPL